MKARAAENFSGYESWDLALPRVPPRSRLFFLEPIGVGTARCESFTSYIARLASAHCVSVHSLFSRELVPAANRLGFLQIKSKSESGLYGYRSVLNGRSRTAQIWIEIIERLTLRRDLRVLTMLPWRNVIPDKCLSRVNLAWCPLCLEEQRNREGPVYEHLLWTLLTVDVCPHHKRKLETVCPHCQNQIPMLTYRSRSGHCSRCLEWLGYPETEKAVNLSPQPDEFNYHLWIANQMAKLIGAAPGISCVPLKQRVTNFIRNCKHITGESINDFARSVGSHEETAYKWLHGEHLPTIGLLQKICYRFDVSFSDVLIEDEIVLRGRLINQSSQPPQDKRPTASHKKDEIKRLLLAAFEEDPRPSTQDIAQRLGYKHTTSLSTKYPDLCKRLTARNRQSLRDRHRPPSARTQRHDAATLERALQNALEESVPPSLKEIGRSLGYASEIPLRKFPALCQAIVLRRRQRPSLKPALQQALEEKVPRSLCQIAKQFGYPSRGLLRSQFPELCKAITARRSKWQAKQRRIMRIGLEAMLAENPPPSLSQAEIRLGDKYGHYLKYHYPDLAQAIASRHASYERAQFESLPRELQAILHEMPSSSLRTVAKRLGHTPEYLKKHCPELSHAISQRHAQVKKKLTLEKTQRAKQRVRQLATDLWAEGLHPSAPRVRRAMNGPTGLERSELSAVLRELKRKLGLQGS